MTAQGYGNEESVGRALRESDVPRDQVFITTKFLPRRSDPVAQAELSLRRLGVEQIDLYLVHWPEGGPTRAWAGLERARELGLARSIGVSNFSAAELETVVAAGKTPPAVNQVEFNPQHYRRTLLNTCARHNVAVQAYSPLGTAGLWRTQQWRRSPRRSAGRRPRSCCAGACSTGSSSSQSRRTRTASARTRRSSILPCRTRTWPHLTRWTRPGPDRRHRRCPGIQVVVARDQ